LAPKALVHERDVVAFLVGWHDIPATGLDGRVATPQPVQHPDHPGPPPAW
jgi:hypothetical protein